MTEENTAKTAEIFELVGEWTTIPDIAEALDLKVTRVHNLISDRAILALRDPETGVRKVPALFINGNRPLESLKGTLTVLSDAGFSDEETIEWLFTKDETLPGRPIDALIDGRKTEIRRRASAMAW
ncbi:Rv2175c family DNA-binding protein [Rothia aerolata]|uniref:Transcriptional regulator n=1 Tax=Rothia aerolata TaxID=1812262 RepID=A0A917ILQ4_9MICC|nr:Rv2175c family DNA-binding protein [Rothia aerolata]GGH56419.1 transcriptional regulator [Rothia aerolata]